MAKVTDEELLEYFRVALRRDFRKGYHTMGIAGWRYTGSVVERFGISFTTARRRLKALADVGALEWDDEADPIWGFCWMIALGDNDDEPDELDDADEEPVQLGLGLLAA